ncbi:hypothetical protein TI05_12470 [Achromatium sp. WMS3]|nr:hypothetical protein TI05_12470 [Achromatium sp. WMS3]
MLNNIKPDSLRSLPRIPRQESVSIQVLLPVPGTLNGPRVVDGTTYDISENGLRLLLSEPLEANRFFDLCVEINALRFLLAGETRWCRYNNVANCYEIGMLIYDCEGTDYTKWSTLSQ